VTGGPRKEIHDALAALTAHRETVGESERVMLDQVIALLASLGDEVAELNERMRWLIGAPYRKKAESVAPGQLAMDLLNALAFRRPEPEPEPEKPATKPKAKRKRRGKELPVRVVEARLTGADRACSCCGEPRAELPPDIQRRFVYEPAKVYTLEEHRFKYACRRCDGGVEAAPPTLPAKPIPGSMASASMLAFLIVGKILDGLPIERIARRLRRHGVDLATSTLNDWFGHAAQMLTFLHRLLRAELLQSELISLDDTPLKAQSRGSPASRKTMVNGRQWLYLGDGDRVAYAEFTEDWKGKHPRAVLEGFDGLIQGDGYGGINPLFGREGGPVRAGCNDHARRRFVAALKCGDTRAQTVVDIYRALYAVECEASNRGLDAAGRAALRQAKSVPLWTRLESAVGALAPQAGTKSPLGKAVVYFERQLATLKVFLTDGRLPISNAHVERQIRVVATFRNNSLFVGSVEAGKRYAVLLTLVLECELAGINPYDYLVDVIDKVANGWPNARAAELLPRAWKAARECEQQLARDTDAVVDRPAAGIA
jgi:transposase